MKKKRIVALLKTTMRISIIQFVLAAGFTCSALAGNVEAQILDKPISISLYQTRMEQVLLQIQKMTEVKFVYSPSIVEIEKKISLNVTDRKLSAVLDEILKPSAIQYKLINDYILLYRNPLVPAEELAPASEEPGNHSSIDENEWKLLQFTIKGRVTDDTNEPLPGVSILLKGTILGTTTDANGDYSISVPDDMASTGVLVVSFIGYTKQEIAIGSQTTVNV